MGLQSDILVPAALESQITKTNASSIKAKMVIEVTEKEFVDNVDGFLYIAKQEGRNRVCHTCHKKGIRC